MDITIRLEQREDYRTVEEMTREAFWNLFVPGCDEHLLAHKLRDCAAFIDELDFVAVSEGKIVGNIMYCRAAVLDDSDVEHEVICFGPVSVWPQLQGKGIGGALIRHSLEEAAKMGFGAVLIYGDPGYYHRFGFEPAKKYGIKTSEGGYLAALMALELTPGALSDISGRFIDGDQYIIDPQELAEFEKTFPYKEKFVTESQRIHEQMCQQVEMDQKE